MRRLSARVTPTLRYTFFKKQKELAQHGVETLDGGDADAADAVELRALQVLDVVKLGELAAVVGRDRSHFRANDWVDSLLVRPPPDQGLVAEVAALDEEEDARRAGKSSRA